MDSQQLVDHLKSRIESFERERADLLERLDACSVSKSELYRLQEENRRRAEEVRELQKALSDAHTYLFDERERLLALQAENDTLKLQEMADRQRIKQLLSLTRPSEQQVVFQQENAAVQACTTLPQRQQQQRSKSPSGRGRGSGGGGERILRTVYLPAAQTEPLTLKCEALQAQLAEQKRFAAEKMAALAEDRQLRERDMEAQMKAATQTMQELEQRLKGAEEALRRTTKDYILARQQKDAAEAEAAALKVQLAAEQQQAKERLAQERQLAAAEIGKLRESIETVSEEAVQGLQQQLRQREDEMLKLEAVHKLIKAQLEGRVVELEARAARLAKRSAQQAQRRALDMEGWVNDVTLLRKQIAAVDRRLKQSWVCGRLPDDERRDQILDRHYRMAPSVAGGVEGHGDSMEQLAWEMSALKGSLVEMGKRVQDQMALEEALH